MSGRRRALPSIIGGRAKLEISHGEEEKGEQKGYGQKINTVARRRLIDI